MECVSLSSRMLCVLQAVFNGSQKTTGSYDFRDVRQKAAAEQIAKASDCGKHMMERLGFSSNNGIEGKNK